MLADKINDQTDLAVVQGEMIASTWLGVDDKDYQLG